MGTVGSFEEQLRALSDELGLKGVSAAVANAGMVEWSGAWGSADKRGRPVTEHTPFSMASLTKPVAAVVILQLVEQGLLDLDTSAASYGLPGDTPHVRLVKARREITVRHLLTHTSGLPLIPFRGKKRASPPGASFSYNGAAFGVLADVAAAVASQPFARLAADRVLAPCGMARSAPGEDGGSLFAATVHDTAQPLGRRGPVDRMLRGKRFSAAAGLISTPTITSASTPRSRVERSFSPPRSTPPGPTGPTRRATRSPTGSASS